MKFMLSCTLLFMHVCVARNVKSSHRDVLRIMGGRNATEDEFPYVVKIMVQSLATRMQSYFFICSASVLTSRWTLTAGHCVTALGQLMMSNETIQTKAVIEYQPSPKAEVAYSEVINTVIHPNYRDKPVRNDIALLHTQPVLCSQYGKVSPIDYATLNGQEVSIVGYGMIRNVGEDPPHRPQVLDVIVKECPDFYHFPQICFALSCSMNARGFIAACPGDSGGPAVHASGIVSVNSMTDIRNCKKYEGKYLRKDRYDTGHDPGSATPVSPFVDWIFKVISTEVASTY